MHNTSTTTPQQLGRGASINCFSQDKDPCLCRQPGNRNRTGKRRLARRPEAEAPPEGPAGGSLPEACFYAIWLHCSSRARKNVEFFVDVSKALFGRGTQKTKLYPGKKCAHDFFFFSLFFMRPLSMRKARFGVAPIAHRVRKQKSARPR